jgi:hypothetical protein
MLANILRALTGFKDGFDDFILQLNDNLHFLVGTLQDNTQSTIDATNDWILEWGDWLVAWLWSIVMGIINFLTMYVIWRFITVTLVAGLAGGAVSMLRTGIAVYLLAWFYSVSFRLLGISYVAFNAWGFNLIPNIEAMIHRGLSMVPAQFQPMILYMNVPEVIHFIFSIFIFIATLKIGQWVFKAPLSPSGI